jgi:hypothetical protein
MVTLDALAKLWPTLEAQQRLLGNGRDTLLIFAGCAGGTGDLAIREDLPWRCLDSTGVSPGSRR